MMLLSQSTVTRLDDHCAVAGSIILRIIMSPDDHSGPGWNKYKAPSYPYQTGYFQQPRKYVTLCAPKLESCHYTRDRLSLLRKIDARRIPRIFHRSRCHPKFKRGKSLSVRFQDCRRASIAAFHCSSNARDEEMHTSYDGHRSW